MPIGGTDDAVASASAMNAATPSGRVAALDHLQHECLLLVDGGDTDDQKLPRGRRHHRPANGAAEPGQYENMGTANGLVAVDRKLPLVADCVDFDRRIDVRDWREVAAPSWEEKTCTSRLQ